MPPKLQPAPKTGKWFYVTGCDSGFGAQVIRLLEAAGHGVFAGCFLEETVEKLRAECSGIVPLRLDVTDEASVEAAARAIKEKVGDKGRLDGLVNNAAILVTPAPVELTPAAAFRKMYEVNVIGMVTVTQSVLPLIRKARGRIVNVASIAGRVGIPYQPAYCASKFAVEGLSDTLRIDMNPWDVTVHIIEPGVFPTTGLYNTFRADTDKMWQALPQPLKDDYGEEFKNGFLEQTDGVLRDIGTKDSSLVPKAMVHALTSASPKYRYRVGMDSRYAVTILSWLHEKTLAWVLGLQLPGLPKRVDPIKAPKDGWQLANKRYASGNGKWWIALFVFLFLWKRGNIWIRARKF